MSAFRAAVLTAPQTPLVIEEVDLGALGPDEALVRLEVAGLCHSDIGPIEGWREVPMPIVLGHEGAGVVEAVGAEVTALRPGDRVIGSFVHTCRECWWCTHGEPHLCTSGATRTRAPRLRRADGSMAVAFSGLGTFAEAMVAGEHSLVKVDSDLPAEQLALIGCGVTTGVSAVLNEARVQPGDTVAVVGCGGVGQAVVQGARIARAERILAVDPVEMKRSAAMAAGATDSAAPEEASDAVGAMTDGRGADHVFEVSGSEAGLRAAFDLARRGGTIVLLGIPKPGRPAPWEAWEHFYGARRIVGCIYGSADLIRDVPRLISYIETGELDVASMVTRRLPLEEINEAVRLVEAGEVLRAVLVP